MFFNKTAPAPKPWHFIMLGVIVITAIIFNIYQSQWPTAHVAIGGQTIKVLVANTYPRQLQGWSDKKDMGSVGGMLFPFGMLGQHAMVMRDMDFPLDIIWLNGGTIVEMAPNLPPAVHGIPEDQLTPYFSRLPSTNVLELPAGFVQAHGLKIGDTVTITK